MAVPRISMLKHARAGEAVGFGALRCLLIAGVRGFL